MKPGEDTGRLYGWILGILLVVGVILRVADLGGTALWIDETTTVGLAGTHRTPGEIISTMYAENLHGTTGQQMPFQYAWLNLFMHWFEDRGIETSPFRVRITFTIFGLGTLPLFYLLGARVYGRRVGLWLLGLGTISFYHVYQSRDMTSYSPLVFFIALHLYALADLLLQRGGGSFLRKAGMSILFVVGAMGALFNHLTAWLLLGTEALLLVAGVVMIALRRTDEEVANYFAPAAFLFLPLILLAVSAVPFLKFILSAMQSFSDGQAASQVDSFSLPLLFYQFAHYGWGRGGGRLTVFLAFTVLGVVTAIGNSGTRKAMLVHLLLCVVPAALFFIGLKRDYYPRYLSVSYVQLIGLTAVGVDTGTRWIAAKLRLQGAMQAVPAAVLCMLLVLWHVGPYRVMFAMHDKLMPMSRIQEWIVENVPEEGLFVMRNGYHLREIPGILPVGRRYPAFADYPNAGIPLNVREWRSQNARSIMQRIPLAPWIADPDYNYGDDARLWTWIYRDFAQQDLLGDDTIERLWQWGLSPHGLGMRRATRFMAYHNTMDDVLAAAAQAGREVSTWPQGPGWVYQQTRDGALLFTPQRPAELFVFKHAQGEGDYMLQLRGVAVQAGSLKGHVETSDRSGPERVVSFQAGNPVETAIGPFRLAKGAQAITLVPEPEGQVALMVHDLVLVPAMGPEGGETAGQEKPQDGAQ